MKTLIFLLEEKSAKECLTNLLPRLLEDRTNIDVTNIDIKYIPFEGKCDLDKRIELYVRNWKRPETKFVVLRDQDAGDCKKIKKTLAEKCANAGHPDALIRIACRELESFYLGDIEAVRRAFPHCSASPATKKFRDPDDIGSPSDELKKITGGAYQKIKGSREIAPFLKLDGSNRSKSFNALVNGISRILKGFSADL